MENASKALIIAGAILIAILLISVGIMVMNGVNDPLSRATKSGDSQAIDIFNAQFTGYEGTAINASSVRTLIQKVDSSNAINQDHQVTLSGVNKAINVNNNKTYKVEITAKENGYVKTINITAN